MYSKWITFGIKIVHVVIHKCVLFLNFELKKKKKRGWLSSVFWIERGIFKKKFNSKFLNVYFFFFNFFVMDVYYMTKC